MSANVAPSAPATNSTGSVHQNVVPSDVGWQFVPQYYTFVNKQPNRLHCFYTKKSTFIHGTEGEDGRPCFGQQEIHQKILSIGFQDCKVFIHSVDAQASAGNGIIIQVIGEMSNRGEAWRKFVQTFFLAEQPNGYFVLNDIFRFLKEESVEEAEAPQEEELEPEVAPLAVHEELEAPVSIVPVVNESAPVEEAVVEPEATPEPEPVIFEEPSKPRPNGLHHPGPEKDVEPVVIDPPAPQETVREPTPTPAPAPAQPSPSPSPAAPIVQPPPVSVPQAQQAPQQPAAPTAPKSWANLAAVNANKWGSAVAQDSRGLSVEVAPAPQPPSRSGTNTPVSVSGAGARSGSAPKNRRMNQHLYQQARNITSPHVIVKGFVDPITNDDLQALLVKYGGKIKEIDFVRNSACAFVEYEDIKSAQDAIIASLGMGPENEDGIHFKPKAGEGEPMRLIVETKKERGDRPPPRGRGGVPPQGNRGNFRGRGRGRGAPTGKPV